MRQLCAAAIAVAGIAGFASAQNMLANPNFDDNPAGLDGWTAFGNASNGGAEFALTAPGSAKLFGNFSGGFDVTGIFQAFPASAGDVFSLSFQSYISSADPILGVGPANDNWVVQKLAFFDAAVGGTEIGFAETIIGDGTFPQDVWIDNAPAVGVAPAGTQRVEAFVLYLQPFNDGGAIFVDNAVLTPAPASLALIGLAGLATRRRR